MEISFRNKTWKAYNYYKSDRNKRMIPKKSKNRFNKGNSFRSESVEEEMRWPIAWPCFRQAWFKKWLKIVLTWPRYWELLKNPGQMYIVRGSVARCHALPGALQLEGIFSLEKRNGEWSFTTGLIITVVLLLHLSFKLMVRYSGGATVRQREH